MHGIRVEIPYKECEDFSHQTYLQRACIFLRYGVNML